MKELSFKAGATSPVRLKLDEIPKRPESVLHRRRNIALVHMNLYSFVK